MTGNDTGLRSPTATEVGNGRVVPEDHPLLRIFDVERAKEFYAGLLGFSVDWEHHFEDNAPAYLQVSRAGLVLHLTEHHGDGCPGPLEGTPAGGAGTLLRELQGVHRPEGWAGRDQDAAQKLQLCC